MRADDIEAGYRDNDDDMVQQRHILDSRKPAITLKILNKLKKMRAAKDLENLMRGDFMQIIYGIPEEPTEGGGLGL